MKPALNLGAWRHLNGAEGSRTLWLPAGHLVTHGVVLGMTGSGKTRLLTVMIEEAARAGVPTIMIHVKGDLPNLLLAFCNFDPTSLRPWVDLDLESATPEAIAARAAEMAEQRRAALAEWQIGESELAAFARRTQVRVLTPGATAGEPLHTLSSLERRSSRCDTDQEAARDALTPRCLSSCVCWGANTTPRRVVSTCCSACLRSAACSRVRTPTSARSCKTCKRRLSHRLARCSASARGFGQCTRGFVVLVMAQLRRRSRNEAECESSALNRRNSRARACKTRDIAPLQVRHIAC